MLETEPNLPSGCHSNFQLGFQVQIANQLVQIIRRYAQQLSGFCVIPFGLSKGVQNQLFLVGEKAADISWQAHQSRINTNGINTLLELGETGKEEALCLLALKEKQWLGLAKLAIGRFGGAAYVRGGQRKLTNRNINRMKKDLFKSF